MFNVINIIAVLYFSVIPQAGLSNHTAQTFDDTILANVGDYPISISEFSRRYSNYLFSSGVKDNILVRESILNNMINEILLYYYDTNKKILNNPEYLKELEATRILIILAYLKENEIYSKITVNEEEIRETFQRVNEKIAARHLFAKTEEEAENLYQLVKIGVDFKLLAKQVFTDSVLKNNGGYLGYFTWGDMDPAFEDAAYSLKVGEISEPVKTEYGYSIIKLEDRITTPLLTESEFQRKKSHLENVIKMRKKEPGERDYINRIFDESKLTVNNEILREILVILDSEDEIELDKYLTRLQECVRYNGKVYNLAEIEQKISDLPFYHRNRINSIESLQAAIEGMLLRDTLYNLAVSKGYDTAKVVLDKFEKYGKNIFLRFKKEEIVSEAKLPDSVVFKYYRDNISFFSTEPELNLQEILVDSEDLADSLMRWLNDGADFGELAKKYSLRKWSAENNGIMGYAPLTKFGSYKDLFWNSQVDEIIGPVKIENLYGIFRLLGKEDSKPLDFNIIKEEVLKASRFENQTEILQDYLEEIRRKVNISINEDLLRSYEITKLKY